MTRLTPFPYVYVCRPSPLKMHACVLALVCTGSWLACVSATRFQTHYDYYFPKHGEFSNSSYRDYFDRTPFGGPLPKQYRLRSRHLYSAFHGDASAFHAFLRSSDRDGEGEFSESWTNECILLLLRLGDDRFAELLAPEDRKTRERAGMAIDSHIEWDKHQFPKTRALYSYRWVPLSQREIEKRQQSPTVSAMVRLTPDEAVRLKTALATDSRFSGVEVFTTGRNERTVALVVGPKTFSEGKMAGLRWLIQARVHRNTSVIFQ